MPHLIIGHTTDTTARIWIQGDGGSTACTVSLNGRQLRSGRLNHDDDYIEVIEFDQLCPDTDYDVRAEFMPSQRAVCGRLRTHRAPKDTPEAFSFILSSCNLSIVSITDLLALLTGTAGLMVGWTSLKLPFQRLPRPKSTLIAWLRPLLWLVAQGLVPAAGWILARTTNYKQPSVQYLRSPFLKLSAIFESWVVTVTLDPDEMAEDGFMAVGEWLEIHHGSSTSRGVIASLSAPPAPAPPKTPAKPPGDGQSANHGSAVAARVPWERSLVLTHVSGAIATNAEVRRCVRVNKDDKWLRIGTIKKVKAGGQWFQPPSFFLHAGDQIYYDFPDPYRPPDRRDYRRAYREAWFEDEPLEHLLAHWPHYMTLDDHELADQFALDFAPPEKPPKEKDDAAAARQGANDTQVARDPEARRKAYLDEATAAYRDYAHRLAPSSGSREQAATGPFWYTFEKRSAGFFVLDTRTRRVNADCDAGAGTMIDGAQMQALLAWLKGPHTPKFIVTSVPFVAELNEEDTSEKREWFRNAQNDKWCASPFRQQRDQIIEAIASNRVEHVVFLTGDMHCCYHATMRIAVAPGHRVEARKYESVTVHELAGGPVNQLQLARSEDFHWRRNARTGQDSKGYAYEVSLEQFHGDVAAVMHIAVDYRRRAHLPDDAPLEPEVIWNVIRTLTDPGPDKWPEWRENQWGSSPEPVMAGRITFPRSRTAQELPPW